MAEVPESLKVRYIYIFKLPNEQQKSTAFIQNRHVKNIFTNYLPSLWSMISTYTKTLSLKNKQKTLIILWSLEVYFHVSNKQRENKCLDRKERKRNEHTFWSQVLPWPSAWGPGLQHSGTLDQCIETAPGLPWP